MDRAEPARLSDQIDAPGATDAGALQERRPLPTLSRVILLAAEPARGTAVRMPSRPAKRFLRD